MKQRWSRWLAWGLWLAAVLLMCSAAYSTFASSRADPAPRIALIERPSVIRRFDPLALAAAADDVTAGNLFREEREPADTDLAATSIVGPTAAQALNRPPRPHLALKGVIGGPPWQAIIAGVPGHDNAVVMASGEVVGGLTVRVVRRDSVVIRGMDTTWHLTMTQR